MKTNVKQRLYTHEGAVAKHISPYEQLRRSVLACMLFEKTFYEEGEDIAERIIKTAHRCAAGGVYALAIEARREFKLRHAPLLLLTALISHPNVSQRNLIGKGIAETIRRADELSELLALYWKDGKKPLSNQLKIGLGLAFRKFDEYSLAKYDRDGAIKLRDVLFLCHAKPKDKAQDAVWKRLIDGKLRTPDTWETNLSAGKDKKETFERLISEKRLGYLALLRNLRNMRDAGVSKSFITGPLVEGAKRSVALPFRFISAAKMVPAWEDIIEQAMLNALEKAERLPGHTAIVVDCSGSMTFGNVSSKSILTYFDAAAALAIICREICDEVSVFAYGTEVKQVRPRRGFALRDQLGGVGHGTILGNAVRAVNLVKPDRSIIITDEQSHDSVPDPVGKGYVINVNSYKNGVGYGPWTHIDGFSEAAISYIQERER